MGDEAGILGGGVGRLWRRTRAPDDGGGAGRAEKPGEAAEAHETPAAEHAAPPHAGTASVAEGGADPAPGTSGDGEPTPGAGAPGPPESGRAALAERLHDWLPIAIVLVSVSAAVMGWLASVADEHATRSDELSRQDFVSQQSALLTDLQQVDSDLRVFGTYEQNSVLGQRLLVDAGKVGGAEGQSLAREGQADVEVARYLGDQMSTLGYSPANPDNYYNSATGGQLQANGTYRPGSPPDATFALNSLLSFDAGLITLAPNRLHAQAEAERDRGVKLIGVAALFIAGLVFFTIAALTQGWRTLWFSACGLGVALIAIVLFPLVLIS